MTLPLTRLAPLVVLSFLSGLGALTAQERPALELQQVELQAGDRTVPADYGHLTVPQRHDDPEGASIRLAFLVRRSFATRRGPPLFVLNGIPGAATNLSAKPYWDAYLALGDVVFLDQRGCGLSEPRLTWERPPYRAELLLSTRDQALANLRETADAIRSFTALVGVDVSAFNTQESARDVDALRDALGYDLIRVMGHSGGSHLGFEYVRSFGDRVDRFVSLGTAGPNDIHSLPSQVDGFLRQISDLAAADERIGALTPNLYQRIEGVLDRIDDDPLRFVVRHPDADYADVDADVELLLGRYGLQLLLLMETGDPEELALFPRLVHELEQGRTDLLRWFVEARYEQLATFPALLFINRASSGATAERWSRIRREAESSPFGLVRCFFSPELDEAFGIQDLGDAFRAPVQSEVPTLFVSATLDGKTPPRRAEAAREGFPGSAHLILENGGHNDLLSHASVHEAVQRFFAGEAMEDERVALPPLRFALLEGPDPLVSHPALD
jgi:pimeloyl-ACP methyl ester carboxylesterase